MTWDEERVSAARRLNRDKVTHNVTHDAAIRPHYVDNTTGKRSTILSSASYES